MTINVECQHCKKLFTKKIDEKTLDGHVTDIRSMGEERHYKVPIKKCPCCQHAIDFIDIFEYPEGIYTAIAE